MIIYRFWFLVCSDSARDTQWKRDRDSERFLCKRIRHFTMSVQRMCTLLERANGAFWLILKTLALSRGSHTHDVLQCLGDPTATTEDDVATLWRCTILYCVYISLLSYWRPWVRSLGVTGILRWRRMRFMLQGEQLLYFHRYFIRIRVCEILNKRNYVIKVYDLIIIP